MLNPTQPNSRGLGALLYALPLLEMPDAPIGAQAVQPAGASTEAPADASVTEDLDRLGLIPTLAKAILKGDCFAQDAAGQLHVFDGGVYQTGGEQAVRRRVKALLKEWKQSKSWSSRRAAEVIEYIRTDAPALWERPPLDRINVINGILDVLTCHLGEHTPEFLSPVQIPVRFDPGANCPHWESFLDSTFPEDAIGVAYEIVAWLMTPDTSQQKALLALGEGSNGKSTFLSGITAFIGERNAANMSLQKVESSPFAASRLVGKMANICPDLPSAHLSDTGIFKALTGGDRINAERKFQDSFEFVPYARLLFSANQPPQSKDPSPAFFRRWLVIPFNRTFEGREIVSREVLDARLADPAELSGVLNKALAALPGLRKNGFTESPSMKAAWDEFRQTTDPVAVWLDRETVEDREAWISKRDLFRAYNEASKETETSYVSDNTFGRSLRRHRPRLVEKQKTIQGRVEWGWVGIELRSANPRSSGYQAGSRDSRDSRDFSLYNRNEMDDDDEGEEREVEIKGQNRVNPVNRVKGSTPPTRRKPSHIAQAESEPYHIPPEVRI